MGKRGFERKYDKEKVLEALQRLDDDITLEEVGEMMNVSRMRICQIENFAIEKLRKIVKNQIEMHT